MISPQYSETGNIQMRVFMFVFLSLLIQPGSISQSAMIHIKVVQRKINHMFGKICTNLMNVFTVQHQDTLTVSFIRSNNIVYYT